MAHDFYTTNLNPITMFVKTTSKQGPEKYKKSQKGNYITLVQLDDYISSKILLKEWNVSTKRLKALFVDAGGHPKLHQGTTYYPLKNMDLAKQGIHVKESIDMSLYISNQELMTMFGFDTNKAFYIASTAKLVKKRFAGNINYYEREKAIEAFSKQKK